MAVAYFRLAVKCPRCGRLFITEDEEPQCPHCGARYTLKLTAALKPRLSTPVERRKQL